MGGGEHRIVIWHRTMLKKWDLRRVTRMTSCDKGLVMCTENLWGYALTFGDWIAGESPLTRKPTFRYECPLLAVAARRDARLSGGVA